MIFKKRLIILLVLAAGASPALAAPHDAAFVLARLSNVEDVTPPVPANEIAFDGTYRLTFTPERYLAGKPTALPISATVFQSEPILGYRYYLLLDREGDRQVIVWRGLVSGGVCLEQDVADEYGLGVVIRRLRKSHPCRNV
jgi:hypothetical protein